MVSGSWLIYGANGFTGQLIAGAALRCGHEPLLGGRSDEKLAPIAKRLELELAVFDLKDNVQLRKILEEVELVLNAAGSFVHTAMPLVRACLDTGTNYLDVCGEVMVMEQIFALDQQARDQEIALIPGVGFNVLASDCLVSYLIEKIENPTYLEIATQWGTDEMSPGSTRTMIEIFPLGTLARRDGNLVRINARASLRQQRFLDGTYSILPVSIGDLTTAYQSTQIPNITTYMVFEEQVAKFYSLMEPVLRRLYSLEFVRRMASQRVRPASSSEEHLRSRKSSQVWASISNGEGNESQAWLETLDSYLFTAEAAVRSVEKVLSEPQVGVLTPAQAFGADFVLEIPGTKRADRLGEAEQG